MVSLDGKKTGCLSFVLVISEACYVNKFLEMHLRKEN